jgi:ribosome maturation factor RimP
MSNLRDKIEPLVRRGLEAAGVELYHWELGRAGPRTRLVVYIDRPQGVSLADCERASRAIEALLEQEDPLAGPYLLEVSSPGVERRLWQPRHYRQAVGKRVRVVLREPVAGRNVHEGTLTEASEEGITLEVSSGPVFIPFSRINRAQLVYQPQLEGR